MLKENISHTSFSECLSDFQKRKKKVTLVTRVALGRKWEQETQTSCYCQTLGEGAEGIGEVGLQARLSGGWGAGESLSERPKILLLDDSVRTTAEGVKVAPWGGH